MRRIYSFNVMDELANGRDVYALLSTRTKLMAEPATSIPVRLLARYLADDTIEWFVSEEETDEG